jgi:hypothetical protein
MIILPRQARYKLRETSKKDRFVAGDEARQGHQEAAQGGQEGGLVYLLSAGLLVPLLSNGAISYASSILRCRCTLACASVDQCKATTVFVSRYKYCR